MFVLHLLQRVGVHYLNGSHVNNAARRQERFIIVS